MSNFSEWITRQFLEWQTEQGIRKTVEEFASYVGVSRPLINMWMNGNQKPGKENINILAEIFGNEIYDVLDLPRPNPYLQIINRLWEFIPEDVQKKLSDEAEKYETQNISARVQKASKRRKAHKFE
jgi:transcriptional regulator with XRE-family HTH domain